MGGHRRCANKSKSNIATLHSSFEYLKNENIINNENLVKLISLFDYKELDIIEEEISSTNIDDNEIGKSSFKESQATSSHAIM